MTTGDLVAVALAVGLLAAAAWLARGVSRSTPWPAIMVAALASAICFTAEGLTGTEGEGPSLVMVTASVVGGLAILAAFLGMLSPRLPRRARVSPGLIAIAAVVVGAVGLAASQLGR